MHVPGDLEHRLLREHRLTGRTLALCDLTLLLPFVGAVDQMQQGVVLPQTDTEHNPQHHPADDQPRAQLFEVLDEAEAVFVADRADRGGHICLSTYIATAVVERVVRT